MKTPTIEECDAEYEKYKDQIQAEKKRLMEEKKRKKPLFDIGAELGPEKDQEIADAVKRLFERRKSERRK